MLLAQKANTVDHLLGPGACRIEPTRETGVLRLQKVNPLRRHDSLHSGGLETLDARLRLECTAAKRGELVTEMFHQLFQLRECGYFRPYAVGHPVLPLVR
jgi:hypothetical protein